MKKIFHPPRRKQLPSPAPPDMSSCSCSSLFPRLPPPEQSNIITYQPTNQTTKQPANHPTTQPTNQPTTKSNPSSTKKEKKKRKKETLHPHGRKANQTNPLFPKLFFFQATCALTKPTKRSTRSTRYLVKLLGLSEEEWMEWMCKIDPSVVCADEHVKTSKAGCTGRAMDRWYRHTCG